MTKLFPEFDAFVADIVNIWEGDSVENVLTDMEGTNTDALVDKLEEDFRETGELPTWLDPNIELDQIAEAAEEVFDAAKAAATFGFVDKGANDKWWPLSIPLTLAAVGALVVISR